MQEPLYTTPAPLPRSFWLYSLGTALLALSPTLLAMGLQLVVNLMNHVNPMAVGGAYLRPGAMEILGNVLLAPLAETAVLALAVTLLRSRIHSALAVSLLWAIVWGLVHVYLQGWFKFLPAVWGFFFFTRAYQVWREHSLPKGFAAALLPHMLVNTALLAVVFVYAM
ncbi:hypothetical protein GALL_537960 [mine drainage metagenome]|uniref:CAAX amino terminal protease self-immunity n=1 Tax=mine drainage metagenome TaxID=410659 RepID=A0A1J5PH96_9ZZZZ